MLRFPVIIVNCKAYKFGEKLNSLALVCARVARKQKITIALAVQASDIYHIKSAVRIPVFAQHIDPVEPGAHTGSILAEAVKQAGASGTLLNHSEKKLKLTELIASISRAKKAGLNTLVCAATPDEAKNVAKLKPDMIAIEPPELIGGKVSVSKAKPQVITATTKAIRNIPILCGAGIKTKADVAKAAELGAKGILVASGVVLAKNPEKVLTDFCKAFT